MMSGAFLVMAAAAASSAGGYAAPFFSPAFTFANQPTDALRDPTTAVFSAERGGAWHVYCSSMICRGPGGGNCDAGYPGRIRHFSTPGTLAGGPAAQRGAWTDEGLVLEPRYGNATAFDQSGVFTPGIVKECVGAACNFFLFFGGVANQSGTHTESVGVAVASSAWGPFVRYPDNPVFSLWDANTAWCWQTSAPARVDEIKAVLAPGGVRVLVVKSVCTNGTALPVLYSPADGSGWGPPYAPSPRSVAPSPLFTAAATCEAKGFEEPTFVPGPDGYLHFIGHDHGQCTAGAYAHYLSNGSLAQWQQVAPLRVGSSGQLVEPVPIPALGDGVYGGVTREEWIDFGPDVATAGLHFSKVLWNWTSDVIH